MQKIITIRHGSTKLNADDRIRGLRDIPLSSEGVREAEEAGKKLKKDKVKIDKLIVSPLKRTKKTAQIISKITGVPIAGYSKALLPWDLGIMTGQKVKEVMPLVEYYARKHPDVPVPDGESFNAFKNRFLGAIYDLVSKDPNHDVGIVTSHRDERLLNAWLKAGAKPDLSYDTDTFLQKGIPPGGYEILKVKLDKIK